MTQNVCEIRDQESFYFLFESAELSVSKGSVNNITAALGYSKACALWVPRIIPAIAKLQKEMYSDFLSCVRG
jgi:hypothetical protein